MHNAELYQRSNALQHHVAKECLNEFASKMTWKAFGERVLDVGCGDGSLTELIKIQYVPKDYERVVGCDISEQMVEFANANHSDEKTDFVVLNIEGHVPEPFQESFDHVVSFNALHWTENLEAAFKNIFQLLANNGECLLAFAGHVPVYDAYRELSRDSQWSSWLTEAERFMPPYQDTPEPEKEILSLLENIGYQGIEVAYKQINFLYDDQLQWKNAMSAINPFDIPNELFDAYLKDLTKIIIRLTRSETYNLASSFNVTIPFKTVVVYAKKN